MKVMQRMFEYTTKDFHMAMYRASRNSIQYPEDCDRIREVAAKLGINLTQLEAHDFWDRYSASRCASWLTPGSDDKIEQALHDFISEQLED